MLTMPSTALASARPRRTQSFLELHGVPPFPRQPYAGPYRYEPPSGEARPGARNYLVERFLAQNSHQRLRGTRRGVRSNHSESFQVAGARDWLSGWMRVPISQIGHSAVPFGVDFGELGSLPSRVRYESNPAPSANPWSAKGALTDIFGPV